MVRIYEREEGANVLAQAGARRKLTIPCDRSGHLFRFYTKMGPFHFSYRAGTVRCRLGAYAALRVI